jgi:acyl carrier protein
MSTQNVLTGSGVTDGEIFEQLRAVISASFEIEPARITLQADLFSDLDLDSIDAVDLAIKLQEITGRRVKPQEFKGIRTVGDVVATVRRLLAA